MIFQHARDPIFFFDIDGQILDINEAATRVYGYSRDEWLKMNVADTRIPEERPKVADVLKKCFEEGCVFETIHRRKDGSTFPVEISSAGTVIENRPVLVAIVREISEHKRVMEELDNTNRALIALSRCTEAIVHAKDEVALLQDICAIAVTSAGYRFAWVGHPEHDREKRIKPVAHAGFEEGYLKKIKVTWADDEYGQGPVGTAIRTKKPYVIRDTLTDPRFFNWRKEAISRGYFSVVGLPMLYRGSVIGALTIYSAKKDAFDENEVALLMELAEDLAFGVVSIRETAQRELAEKALKEAKTQAELYLDLMSHDINNMNQAGMGFLELALDKVRSEGILGRKDIELLEKPLEAISNISRLITNIKKAQKDKNQKANLNRINVAEIITQEKEQFTSVSGREITITCQICRDCWVMANEFLRDVFDNLIHNSIKHSSGSLIIGIRLEKVTVDETPYCRIEIEDNGPGICDERKESIIDMACQRAKKSGRGFGLCLVKTLVNNYCGTIKVEDRVPGEYFKGARFVVILPAVDSRAQAQAQAQA